MILVENSGWVSTREASLRALRQARDAECPLDYLDRSPP